MTDVTIGIATSAYLDRQTWVVDYAAMKADGFDCADVNHYANPQHPVYTMDDTQLRTCFTAERDALRQAGVEPYQFHAVWPTDETTAENRAQKTAWIERNVVMCAALGCRRLVIHPDMPSGWEDEPDPASAWESNRQLFTRLLPQAAANGVTLCLENMPFKPHALSRVEAVAAFADEMAHPNMGVCLDTGHAAVFGESAGDAVRRLGRRLKALHIHDNDGDKDLHQPPMTGVIDWEDFRRALQEIGFDGCVSLECGGVYTATAEGQAARRALAKAARYLTGR